MVAGLDEQTEFEFGEPAIGIADHGTLSTLHVMSMASCLPRTCARTPASLCVSRRHGEAIATGHVGRSRRRKDPLR